MSLFRILNGRSGVTSAAALFRMISPLTKNPSLTVVSGSSYGECPTGAPLGLLPWGANDQIFDLVTILYSPLFFV